MVKSASAWMRCPQLILCFRKVGRAVPARRVLGITALEPKGGAEGLRALPFAVHNFFSQLRGRHLKKARNAL